MNTRERQKTKACFPRIRKATIMALLKEDNSHFERIMFIDANKWDEAKAHYGDRLHGFLDEG